MSGIFVTTVPFFPLLRAFKAIELFLTTQTLVNGDSWALAVDCAIGRLLDAFIVTNHKDSHVLRACAREANYPNLHIYVYDFSRPRSEFTALFSSFLFLIPYEVLVVLSISALISSLLLSLSCLLFQVAYSRPCFTHNKSSNYSFGFTFWQSYCNECFGGSG